MNIMKADQPAGPAVHLYRGASSVRSWSRYKLTDKRWALCGVRDLACATEDAALVSCAYCVQLMQPAKGKKAKTGIVADVPGAALRKGVIAK